MKNIFNSPKTTCTTANTKVEFDNAINLIRDAKNMITFMRDKEGRFRFFYSDLGKDEFLMLAILMCRHKEVHDFFKLVFLDIENYRTDPCPMHDFTYKALEYIQLRNQSANPKYKSHELHASVTSPLD